jgi:predicted metalloprotease with PDZ domain
MPHYNYTNNMNCLQIAQAAVLTTALAMSTTSWVQAQEVAENANYQYFMSLSDVENDMLKVTMIAPQGVTGVDLVFHFPATAPGTYEILNFGQFVQELKAYDRRDKELKVDRTDQNTWKIKADRKIHKITYKLEDSWDATIKNPVFEAAGTNFEVGKNFLLNASGCFGFFKGHDKKGYTIKINRPSNFYGATSLTRDSASSNFDTDAFVAANYNDLVDQPIMYCVPDTATYEFGNGKVLVSVYSPNKKVKAKQLGNKVLPIIAAQNQYLGHILPVDKYVFLLYLSPDGYPSSNVGALEHSQSSVFCLIEEAFDKISKQVAEIAAHEFFHILTPLYIHSEEIQDFDYLNPKMSQHLWLYEGVVEYMAQHVHAKYNFIDDEAFLEVLGDKVRSAVRFKEGLAITEMSKKCLQPDFAKQYNNVYYKGAMLGACLDLKLLALSKGNYGIVELLQMLASKFGKDTPFKDDQLFDIIVEDTKADLSDNNQIRLFFNKYVKGADPLPYKEIFEPFGIEYLEEAKVEEISPLGGIENGVLKTDSLSRFYIAKPEKMDEFGKNSIGFKQDDIIVEWNGKPFTPKNVSAILLSYLDNAKKGDKLEIKLLRKKAAGGYEPHVVKTELSPILVDKKHVFRFMKDANPEQLMMRKIWLEPKSAK